MNARDRIAKAIEVRVEGGGPALWVADAVVALSDPVYLCGCGQWFTSPGVIGGHVNRYGNVCDHPPRKGRWIPDEEPTP